MSTAPSNPTGTAVTFCWPRLWICELLDGVVLASAVEAPTVPLGVGVILFGAGDAGVFAGAAPAEH